MGNTESKSESIVLVEGFQSAIDGSKQLEWFCAPDSWNKRDGEGSRGKWSVEDDALVLYPPTKKDFWRKTYYEPLLIKDDAPFLYAKLPRDEDFTMETTFEFEAGAQFDQAGLCIRLDGEHWLKTGIEVVDGSPRLSCVVTNVYSDWSTQAWKAGSKQQIQCSIRVHGRKTSFVVEADFGHGFEFIRIAHLDARMKSDPDPIANQGSMGPSPTDDEVWAGVFGACPTNQTGKTKIVFRQFEIRSGSSFDHKA